MTYAPYSNLVRMTINLVYPVYIHTYIYIYIIYIYIYIYPPPCFSTRACFKLFTSFLILLLFSPLLLLQKRLSDIFYYLLLRDHRPFTTMASLGIPRHHPPLFDSENRLKKRASQKHIFSGLCVPRASKMTARSDFSTPRAINFPVS